MRPIAMNLIFSLVIISSYTSVGAQPLSRREFSCPGVDLDGNRPALGMPLSPVVTTSQEDSAPVPSDLVEKALPIIGFFESSSSDPYININSTDVISIGYLQWNWNSGSIFSTFMRNIRDSDILLADSNIRLSLKKLKSYSSDARVVSKEEALEAAKQLVLNKSLTRMWLGTNEMRSRQKIMMEPTLKLAYSYTKKWLSSYQNISSEDLLQTYVFFLDMVVYNGGRAAIWREQVDAFQVGKTSISIAEQLKRWALKCASVVRPTSDSRMYSVGEAVHNTDLWMRELSNAPAKFNKNQIDLLVFGYLRSIMSTGSNKPHGFPGIFAADVLSRRGTVALRVGKVHGVCFSPDAENYIKHTPCH